MIWTSPAAPDLFASPKDAINVFDFEPVVFNQETFTYFRRKDPRVCASCHVHGIGSVQERPNYEGIDMSKVARVAQGKVPIIFDSGLRRGTDIFKALAMGASAVCIGRPYLWGLGVFGQPGVERVLEILRVELFAVMQQMGVANIAAISPAMVRKA